MRLAFSIAVGRYSFADPMLTVGETAREGRHRHRTTPDDMRICTPNLEILHVDTE